MKIKKCVVSEGMTGYYLDDKHAIQDGAKLDGNYYFGKPKTEGFKTIRQAGESVSIMLVLEDGQVGYGDCATGQYSGIGGRDKPFFSKEIKSYINKEIKPKLEGMELDNFRETASDVESWIIGGERLHTGVAYGITQALLDGVAKIKKMTMAEVIAKEYGTKLAKERIPIFIQSGDDRYIGADKGIMKRAEVIPHSLINRVEGLTGKNGEGLYKYAIWLKNRIQEIGEKDYFPIIHLDVYGPIGYAFNQDINKVVPYIKKLEEAVKPYPLQLEMPMDMGSKEATMETFKKMKEMFKKEEIKTKVVVDEWANNLAQIKEWADSKTAGIIQVKTIDVGGINRIIEAIIYCKAKGVGAYLGGTCNETGTSARVCANIAIATQPDQMLAKPGMGADEGYMIVYNEMMRVLALIESRKN